MSRAALRRLESLVLGLLLFSVDAGSPAKAAESDRKPNLVVILADDMGFSDLGCYGAEIETPNLDALAAEGVRFTQFYNTARCWPSRAALLTGYYAQQVNRDPPGRRPKWAALMPELLRTAGYRAYHSGKWHVDGKVLAGGFDRSYRLEDYNNHFFPKKHELDDQPLPPVKPGEEYYSTRVIAERAIEQLTEHHREHQDKPFFLYLAFTSPHFPLQALPEDIDRYKDRYKAGWDVVRQERWRRIRAMGIVSGVLSAADPEVIPAHNLSAETLAERVGLGEVLHIAPWDELTDEQKAFQAGKMAVHAAMVDRMDREIGRVIDQIKAMGAYEDSLIVFMSDNGASAEQIIRGGGHDPSAPMGSAQTFLGLGQGWATTANAPFRLYKIWNHEGGVSTPLIARWPAGVRDPGGLRHAPAHLVDLAPTFLELAGVTPPKAFNGDSRPPLPGRSLVPVLKSDVNPRRPPIFFKHEGRSGLRDGDWKIVRKETPEALWELYNLVDDRTETRNLAAEHPERLKTLVEVWTRLDEQYQREGASLASEPK